MLEINYSRNENTLYINNHGNGECIILTVYYTDGKNKGEFGGLLKHRILICDDLIHFEFPLEAEILTLQGNVFKNYKFKETGKNNILTIIDEKEKSLEEIIKLVFEDTYNLHPPINEYLQGNRLMKEFFDLIYAYVDTEYRELDNKLLYGQYLQAKYSIEFSDREQSNVVLAKCVALMELLDLDKDEMSKLLLKVLRL